MLINGTDSGNVLTGTLGDDIINALGGADTINGTDGNDQVDGGAGNDRLVFTISNSARFSGPTGSRTYTITADHVTDSSGLINTSFNSVERISFSTVGSGDFGDTIDASGFTSVASAPLTITTGSGDDTITGSAVNDLIIAGRGANWVDAGGGLDEVRFNYDGSAGGTMYVTGSGNTFQSSLNGQTNTALNAETVYLLNDDLSTGATIDASAYTGDARLIFINSNFGSDVFVGHNGVDFFGTNSQATVGGDTYTGNGGADIYDYTFAVGAMQGDRINDFDSDDIIDLQFNNATNNGGGLLADQFIGSAAFSGVAGQYRYESIGGETLLQADTNGDGVADETLTIGNGQFALGETFSGSNQLHIIGTSGTAAGEFLEGTIGDDNLYAQGGNDTIAATAGVDQIYGGDGFDQLRFVMANTARFDPALGSRAYTLGAGWVGTDAGVINTYYHDVEQLYLSTVNTGDFGDTIDASTASVQVVLRLGGGDDTVRGSAFDDDITSGLGVNAIDAGDGYDIAYLQSDNSVGGTIYVSLVDGAVVTTLNGVQTNSAANAEEARVQGFYANIGATVDASALTGYAGTLVFWDNNGSNNSIGHAGTDVFANIDGYGAGNDVYTGNGGADIFDYTVAIGAMNGDSITDFDADDIIDLRYNDNDLNGGGAIADHFVGSAEFSGVAGEYRYYFADGETRVTVDTDGDAVADQTLTIANDYFNLVENAVGSNQLVAGASTVINGTTANDTLTGTMGNDLISGLAGRDTINGTQGHDIVDGGSNSDTLTFVLSNPARFQQGQSEGRTYVITNGDVHCSSAELQTDFTSIETVRLILTGTGDWGDTVDTTAVTTGLNIITTFGNGNDYFLGGSGNDTVTTGGGFDTAVGGAGSDTIAVSETAGTTNILLTGDDVSASVTQNGMQAAAFSQFEIINIGTRGNSNLTDGLVHTLDASGYTGSAQVFFGDHNGTDNFIGSAGRDFFVNTSGNTLGGDTYRGNGGADWYDYTVAVSDLGGDTILDFDADDTIDLQFNTPALNSGGYLADHFIGNAAFSGVAGEYRYEASGGHTLLQVDTDGDGTADETLTIANGQFALRETVAGSNQLQFAATVTNGTNASDILTGTLGDDLIYALGSRDTVNATQGHDIVDGGANTNDTLNVVMSIPARFAVPATGPRTYVIDNGHVGNLQSGLDTSFVNIENVRLNLIATGDYGDTVDSSAFSGGFNLIVSLGNGDDVVHGGGGSETVYTGFGVNWIDAGAGNDTVYTQTNFASGSTLIVQGTGNAVTTVHNGSVTNTIFNAETVSVGGDASNPFVVDGLTNIVDASTYTGTAMLLFYDHSGDDVFIGSSRADLFANTFNVTVGNDTYTGGGGADIFDYTVAINALNHDVITDFDADDTIDFQFNDGTVAGQLLCDSFVGGAAFSGVAGQYRYADVAGQTLFQIDTDGDAQADRTLTLSNGSFVIAETSAGSNILHLVQADLSGVVADGYVAGATLFVDTNGNHLLDTGEVSTVTDAAGNYALSTYALGTLVATGGTNTDTGFGNQLSLMAPIGASVVNPLTTLIAAIVEAGAGATSAAQAEAMVAARLGLSSAIDFLTYDPLAHAGDATALAAQKAAATIANMLATTENFAGGNSEAALLASLAELVVSTAPGTTINLADSSTLTDLLQAALPGAADLGVIANELAGDATAIAAATTVNGISDAQVAALLTGDSLANVLTGNGFDNFLSGLGGNDTLYGLGGNDWLDGGTGADRMEGGSGNDVYIVDNSGDAIIELANQGLDTVRSSISFTLGANLENLTLTDSATDGTGNSLGNILTGNDLSNHLSGGAGNDWLIGGDGIDYLRGGSGNDVFVAQLSSQPVAAKSGPLSLDVILDFSAGDKIDLSGLDANLGVAGRQDYSFAGSTSGKGAGDLTFKIYDSVNGAEKALGIDIDGVDGASPLSGPVTMVFGNHDGGGQDWAMALVGVSGVNSGNFIYH